MRCKQPGAPYLKLLTIILQVGTSFALQYARYLSIVFVVMDNSHVFIFRLSAELSVVPLYPFTEVLVGGVAVSMVGSRVDFFESKRFFPSQDGGRIMFTGTIGSASECAERSRCPCPREWPEDAWRDQEKRDHGRTLMQEVGNRPQRRGRSLMDLA